MIHRSGYCGELTCGACGATPFVTVEGPRRAREVLVACTRCGLSALFKRDYRPQPWAARAGLGDRPGDAGA